MTFQEYPKWLHHPQFTPAVVSADPPGFGKPNAPPGSPDRFPPVLVNNKDQEDYHVSRGYAPGNMDRAAYERRMAAPVPLGRGNDMYPRWENGVLVQDPDKPPEGPVMYPKWVLGVLCKDEATEKALLVAHGADVVVEEPDDASIEEGEDKGAEETVETRRGSTTGRR